MNSTKIYMLPESVTLTPVRELPEVLRREIGVHAHDDVVLSRANSRTGSKLLGARASWLTALFRTPQTITQAVEQFSREAALDSGVVVEEALPVLKSLIEGGFLVSTDAKNGSAIASSLPSAGEIGGWRILQSVQMMEDTEIYQVRSNSHEIAALKIACAGHSTASRVVKHEAYVLSGLHSVVAPRLLSFGSWNSRPYLITEWLAGSDAAKTCGEFRASGDPGSKNALLLVTSAILRAYAALHKRGVIHGDIHPRNVLIGPQYSIKVLDFGAARILGSKKVVGGARVGVGFFLEPELAEAIRAGARLPLPSARGEQYSLAALIYLLLTGRHYLDFIVERSEMLRQIAEDQMVSFERRGFETWPGAEPVLRKALAKEPADRFPSVEEFARAWELSGAALCER